MPQKPGEGTGEGRWADFPDRIVILPAASSESTDTQALVDQQSAVLGVFRFDIAHPKAG